jgi:hypothetical protein
MAASFTVEDGTGLDDANSYQSVQDFKDYHDSRGNDYASIVTTDPDDIEKALVSATDYIDEIYGGRVKGVREFPLNPQALLYPRTGLYYDGECLPTLPIQLFNAVNEYAFVALTQALAPIPVIDSSGRTVIGNKVVVGPIEKDLRFNEGSSFIITRPYPKADKWMKPLIFSSNRTIRA